MITVRHKGDYSKVTRYFEKLEKSAKPRVLEKYAQLGVQALASATPVDTGTTASSWYYEIESQNGVYIINFCNSNINKGVPIAIILDVGHGTGTGGWVEGRHYIEPALQPIFDKLAEDAWREVTNS